MRRAVLSCVLLLLLAACGGGQTGGGDQRAAGASMSMPRPMPHAATVAPVSVDLREFSITPNAVSTKTGGTLEVRNRGTVVHNLDVLDADHRSIATTKPIRPGSSARLDLGSVTPGLYLLVCDVPGHQDQGMVATLTIS